MSIRQREHNIVAEPRDTNPCPWCGEWPEWGQECHCPEWVEWEREIAAFSKAHPLKRQPVGFYS